MRVSQYQAGCCAGACCALLQVSRPGGGFLIAPELIVEHDQQDMEDVLASMPQDLQVRPGTARDGCLGEDRLMQPVGLSRMLLACTEPATA
jgi:hypothetical protein